MFALDYAARSDVGLVRSTNQDSAYAGPNLLLVADGMGGHAGGDVASAIAVLAMEDLDDKMHDPDSVFPDIEDAIEEARLALIHASANTPRLMGLGTTVVALLRTEKSLALAHMGDSRAYLLRNGELRQFTVDHTFVQHLVDTGRIAPEEAAHHPNRNVVMRVLSDFDVDLRADTSLVEALPGDRWLLCSDGLSGFVELPELQAILAAGLPPGPTADALIEAAKRAMSTDNITAIVADVVDDGAATASHTQATETVGAAAAGGPLQSLVAQSIDAVRLLPRPAVQTWDDDDAVPMTAADFAAAGLVDPRSSAPPPDPPSKIPTLEIEPLTEYHAPPSATQPAVLSQVDTAPITLPLAAASAGFASAPTWPAPPQSVPTTAVSNVAVPSGSTVVLPAATQTVVATPQYVTEPASRLTVEDTEPQYAATSSYYDDDSSARPAPRRHPVLLAVSILAALALVSLAAWRGYVWTQNQYYVGQVDGRVAIFQGVPANLGPIALHQAIDILDTEVAELPQFFVDRLDGTIRTESLPEARERADRLIAEALGPTPTETSPTPTPQRQTPLQQAPTTAPTSPTTPAATTTAPTTPAGTTPTQPRQTGTVSP